MKTLAIIALLIQSLNPSFAQNQSLISPCLNYPLHNIYSSSLKNYHKYIVSNVIICPINNKKGFNRDTIFKIMMSNASFQAPTNSQQSIDNCGKIILSAWETYDNVFFKWIKELQNYKYLAFLKAQAKSPIITYIDNTHYSATNYTLKGHPLHDGKVNRTVILENGNIKIYTFGEGNSNTKLGYLINSCKPCMKVLWDKVDERLKAEVERRLNQPIKIVEDFFVINPTDVTHSVDNQFKWYKWESAPAYFKIAASHIKDNYGNPFSETINYYLNDGSDVYISAIDLDNDGIAGLVFKTSGKCSVSHFGCRFGLWENGGSRTVQLGFLNLGEPKPSTNGIIVGNGDFDPLIVNNSISSTYKDSLLSLFKYSKTEVQDPFPSNVADASLVGGATPEELGKILLKAVKTNNKDLYKACVHPEPNGTIDKIAENFDLLREKFPEQGLTNWDLIKFSRVKFTKDSNIAPSDGGTRNGEQVRRNFEIEFTYNNEFAGIIGPGTILTYKGKFFIFSGVGSLEVGRL